MGDLAKFYGGKALTGTKKQRQWGDRIREDVISKSNLSDKGKENLLTICGLTDTAKFWIENRNVKVSEFVAENIVSQYRGLASLELEHRDFLARTNPTFEKNKRRLQIKDYCSSISFNFASSLV